MKSISSLISIISGSTATLLGVIIFASASTHSNGAEQSPIIDDFSDAIAQTAGVPRMIIDDKQAGGQSTATTAFGEGVMSVDGKLVPGRGSPAFVSIPLVLAADGGPSDLSKYTGVLLRVKLESGSLIVQASSTDVTNFDYHSSAPITRSPDGFQEVKIPFAALKQVWSAPTSLNLKSITSINLVSVGMTPDSFAYEIDEIGFY